MKAKYWWKVVEVNPDVNPEEGYLKVKVGDIYGTQTKKQNYLRCKKNRDFIHECVYHKRIQITEEQAKSHLLNQRSNLGKTKEGERNGTQ